MIFVGKYAGFCPGVQRAVDKAEELAEKRHREAFTLWVC